MSIDNPITNNESRPLDPRASNKARTFLAIMRNDNAPRSFNELVLKKCVSWGLLSESEITDEILTDNEKFITFTESIRGKIEQDDLEFAKLFTANSWSFDKCIEGKYSQTELEKYFPTALVLQQLLGEQCSFSLRAEPGEFYLHIIERESGKRQVFRTVITERTVEEINTDAAIAPEIIPPFEAIKLPDGRTCLLVDWIDGHVPVEQVEFDRCLQESTKLLIISMDRYDVWPGNFVIENSPKNNSLPRVFYIDKGIIQQIAKAGYSQSIVDRQSILNKDIQEEKRRFKL